jgi:hypothetical protein
LQRRVRVKPTAFLALWRSMQRLMVRRYGTWVNSGVLSTCLCAWAVAAPATCHAQNDNRLELTKMTANELEGQLVRGNIGLRFKVFRDYSNGSVRVSTLDGRMLFDVEQKGPNIRTRMGDGRFEVTADPNVFEQLRSSGGRPDVLPRRLITSARASGDPLVAARIERLPEYALLVDLSVGLGKHMGLTGKAFPPAQLIHAMAMTAAKRLNKAGSLSVSYRWQYPPTEQQWRYAALYWRQWLAHPTGAPPGTFPTGCRDPHTGAEITCPESYVCKEPDRSKDCFGMCGPGCGTCWEWVCGDCCYHDFCAAHDAQLRACEASALGVVACVNAIAPWYFGSLTRC